WAHCAWAHPARGLGAPRLAPAQVSCPAAICALNRNPSLNLQELFQLLQNSAKSSLPLLHKWPVKEEKYLGVTNSPLLQKISSPKSYKELRVCLPRFAFGLPHHVGISMVLP
ncbi:hypothetical protein L2E82_46786, partial [Cichorium intybus]